MLASTQIMIQGSGSDVGKSTVVAGLCRWLHLKGISVAPFKPQNMALNSAVTADGGEIGRAQALQAQACGLEPHVDMNPVLLKPSSDKNCQIIVRGRALNTMGAWAYHDYKKQALPIVLESFQSLSSKYQAVIVEGAGSPAEINLRDNDIANMGFAEPAGCPVVLVADIDKGGVFAQIVGTLELLSESERRSITGFIINKFRGDVSLLQGGLDWLEEYTGKPVIGVLPYLQNFYIDAEDAIDARQIIDTQYDIINIIVPVFTRMSNHTDFDALRLNPQVNLIYVGQQNPLPPCDLIILPGSKNVREDLRLLKQNRWDADIQKHLRYGGKLLGVCGGYQMLGKTIIDEHGIEDLPGAETGLGLLDLQTQLRENKQLRNVKAILCRPGTFSAGRCDELNTVELNGYEIHCGLTEGPALENAFCEVQSDQGNYLDGAVSEDGLIIGTYLHGLFDQPSGTKALLAWAGANIDENCLDIRIHNDRQLDRLAEVCDQHLDHRFLNQLARLNRLNDRWKTIDD